MTQSQKIVAIGAASGVAAMLLSMVILYRLLPHAAPGAGLADRLAYHTRSSGDRAMRRMRCCGVRT